MSSRIAFALAVLACAGCAGSRSLSPEPDGIPVQLREQQIIVAVPLVTPALRVEFEKRLGRHFDLQRVGAFPLASIDVHCIVFAVERGRDVDRLMQELAAYPGVRLVQRNQVFDGTAEPEEDPYASFQHGAEALRAKAVHRWATGRGVRVAVVDTGVDHEHPDLAGRVALHRNFVQGGDASFLEDAHGTAVAGVIAARADNGAGIYGIAPDASLVVAKACWHAGDPSGTAICSSWTLARALDFAIGADVRVVNLSLAGPADPLLARLISAASRSGIVVVAAAGDGTRTDAFPASLDSVIGVVQSESAGSASGEPPAVLAAPGRDIITTAPGARYRFLSGSSLSTAHVSGAVALVLERAPQLSPAEVSELLETTARPDTPARPAVGRVDACAAIRRLSGGEACPAGETS